MHMLWFTDVSYVAFSLFLRGMGLKLLFPDGVETRDRISFIRYVSYRKVVDCARKLVFIDPLSNHITNHR